MDRSKTLIDVKTALAEKYERLANIAGSAAKRRTFAGQAVKFRRQVIQLQRNAVAK